ncbi:MAG TPA: alpha-glucuronidase family glycosyl hydrolase, partial [Candidatus Anammoximicrobium sp.]|nr:alpha-glucuronidase family glycosyl hydrolase [Candidatus Anammoximicrobium sp.]
MSHHAPLCLLCLIVPLASSFASMSPAASLRLAAGGRTSYSIVLDPDATTAEKHAAEELAVFLKQVTGADFPVQATAQTPAGPLLVVGPGRVASAVAPNVNLESLEPDGIVIETVGENLLLAGDRPRGTLYAVYSFLEDAVGCRWWSSKASTIPRLPDLTVPEQHVRYVPPLEYRETFWADAFDGNWAARNKSNGDSERLEEKHGGKIRYGGPFFVHTFAQLVPPATYFKEHPEYFSEVNGQRLDGYAQVCVT